MADVLESTGQAADQSAATASGGTLGDAEINPAVQALAQVAVNLAGTSGFLMKNPELTGYIHAPFALLPRKLPSKTLNDMRDLMPLYNKLTDVVARDFAWLRETLRETAAADEFTNELLKIATYMYDEGVHQPLALGLHRSDYMLHKLEDGSLQPLQIELNTVAAGFGSLAGKVSSMHEALLKLAPSSDAAAGLLPSFTDGAPSKPNRPVGGMASAIAQAHTAFKSATTHADSASVLFLTQPKERNVFDQLGLAAQVQEHGASVVWGSMDTLASSAVLVLPSGERVLAGSEAPAPLAVASQVPDGAPAWSLWAPQLHATPDSAAQAPSAPLVRISTVYFRAGYTPDDYQDTGAWNTRRSLERSDAVKCPNVFYQLVGAKKVQQVLAAPGVLEHFVKSSGGSFTSEHAAALRGSFAGLWSLTQSEMDEGAVAAVADAKAHPEDYVMKPQREGGGNNFYGAELAAKLRSMQPAQLSAYILMKRIKPQPLPAVVVKGGQAVFLQETVEEIGTYGAFLGDGSSDVCNSYTGMLVRTKGTTSDEGGVAKGYAVLDSPFAI